MKKESVDIICKRDILAKTSASETSSCHNSECCRRLMMDLHDVFPVYSLRISNRGIWLETFSKLPMTELYLQYYFFLLLKWWEGKSLQETHAMEIPKTLKSLLRNAPQPLRNKDRGRANKVTCAKHSDFPLTIWQMIGIYKAYIIRKENSGFPTAYGYIQDTLVQPETPSISSLS